MSKETPPPTLGVPTINIFNGIWHWTWYHFSQSRGTTFVQPCRVIHTGHICGAPVTRCFLSANATRLFETPAVGVLGGTWRCQTKIERVNGRTDGGWNGADWAQSWDIVAFVVCNKLICYYGNIHPFIQGNCPSGPRNHTTELICGLRIFIIQMICFN